MKRRLTSLAVGCLLLAPPALAVKPGGTLYIKSKDTKVLEKADAKAKSVGTLQPGDEVTWNGPDDKNKQFHAIDTGKVKGFTLQANLTPSKQAPETTMKDNGAPIDAKAFASSGAATKALSGGALKTASGNPTQEELARALISVEATAKSVDPKDATTFVLKRTGGGGK
jgi:hypothetical protein